MQFTTIALLAVTSTLVSGANLPRGSSSDNLLLPVVKRATCDTTPAASSGSASPISKPTATTAADCQAKCEANTQCQSFLFGLDASGAIACQLYSVAASQIPVPASDGLKAFDKGCTGVPTTAPTASSSTSSTSNSGANAGSGSTGTTGTGTGTTNSNTGSGAGTTTTTTTTNNNNNGGKAAARSRVYPRDVCGAAPTGNAQQSASPLQTKSGVNSAADCLTLCKQTSGCQSVEFGKTVANGPDQCLLFSVTPDQLPAPTNGQSIVAYNVNC